MFLWGDAYLAQRREPILWVVQDLIPVGGKANLFGKPKAGKSFFALQLASAVSSGAPHFLGFPIHKHGPVVYIQVDTSGSVWFDRVKTQAALGLNFSQVAFADTESGIPFPLNIHADAPTLKIELEKIKPVLVIWDTIRELHPGNENESDVMKNVMSQILYCTRGEGWTAANYILSHRKKENPNYEDDLMNANRGSSYIAGSCDSIMQLFTPSNEGATVLEFQSRTHEKDRRPLIFDPDSSDGIFTLNTEGQAELALIKEVLAKNPTLSYAQVGEILAPLLNRTPKACAKLVARKVGPKKK